MDENSAEFHYTIQFGNQLWLSKKFTDAWSMFFRALKQKPLNGQLLFHLGTLSHEAGEYERAIGWFSLVVAQGRNDPRVFNNLGESFRSLGKFREAMKCFKKGLELSPDMAQLHNNLGLAQSACGDLAGAETSFRTAISLLPDYQRAHRNLARVLQDQGRRVEAAGHFHKSRAGDPWPRNLASQNKPS